MKTFSELKNMNVAPARNFADHNTDMQDNIIRTYNNMFGALNNTRMFHDVDGKYKIVGNFFAQYGNACAESFFYSRSVNGISMDVQLRTLNVANIDEFFKSKNLTWTLVSANERIAETHVELNNVK